LFGYIQHENQEIRLITEEDLNGFWQRLDLLLKYLPQGIIPVKSTKAGLVTFND